MKNPKVYWDSFESSYQMGPQKHRVYLLNLLDQKEINTILDVGCGTGPIYELIKLPSTRVHNFKYKGVDYAQGMIEVCKREFPEGDFEVQDARALKEKDTSWDCVLLLHCLDHLDDYKSAIKEASRVAKRYICIVLWRPFSYSDNLNSRNMYGKKEGDEPWEDTHLHEYSQKDLEKAFQENGLTIEHTAFGETINSDSSHYNFLYLLRK